MATREKSKKNNSPKKISKPTTPVKKVPTPKTSRQQFSDTVSDDVKRLHGSGKKQLEGFLKNGQIPKIESIVGYQFKGLNAGFMPKLLGIQKFIKCFYWHDFQFGKTIMGHNMVVKQNGIDGKYQIIFDKKRRAKVQGYYLLEEARANKRFHQYHHSVLLNYGRGDNAWYDPAKMLRDYLCQPFADNNNLLLGKAYFALGPLKIFGGFFILEKLDTFEEN